MSTDRLYTLNDPPSDLLRRILTNLLKICSLSTRGVLTCVCKSWAGAVRNCFLSPGCLDGIGLLTQRQSQRFNNTVSNIKSLRTRCLLSSQVRQAMQVAEACPRLRVLEVYLDTKYGDFNMLDKSDFGVFMTNLLYPFSWALRPQKVSLYASDTTLLTKVITRPLNGNILDCITAGHIDMLRLAFPSSRFLSDVMAFECMPALQCLEVGVSTLYEVGFTKIVRGAPNPRNLGTFRTSCEVHCTCWSGPRHLQKTWLSSVKPFSTIKSWIAGSAQCAALICKSCPKSAGAESQRPLHF